MKEENYNLKLIKGSIKELKTMASDDEAAHGYEDNLRDAVLKDIASGMYTAEDCQKFAKEVLKTNKIKFSRWCA